MESIRVLYISQEITPFLPETPMSKISRYLPQEIQEMGCEIRTFMPLYGTVNERRNQLHEVIRLSGMNLVINKTDHPLVIKVSSIQAARMQVYFIDGEDYFQRKFKFNDQNGDPFHDNDERAMFFAKGVLETVKKLQWEPDIIHCHGWFSSFVPFYLRKVYHKNPLLSDAKIVYSFYNNNYDKQLNGTVFEKVLTENVIPEDVSELKEPNFKNMNQFVVRYVDGFIQGETEINPSLINMIKHSNKPFLTYQPEENYVKAYFDFYSEILNN